MSSLRTRLNDRPDDGERAGAVHHLSRRCQVWG